MTDRESHIRFRLTPIPMTLDDLELRYVRTFSKFCGISQIFEATTVKRMKIDPDCQRQRCNPLTVLFNIMFLALICCRFLRYGHDTRTAVVRFA